MNPHDCYNNITRMYLGALRKVLVAGHETSPRGLKTKELLGVSMVMTNPNANILRLPERKLNFAFSVAEWVWIQFGYDEAKYIVPFNSQLAKYSDDGEIFAGAYGPKVHDQWDYCVKTLEKDPDSRQAVINIWRERQNLGPSSDIPCTLSWQFLIREGQLHMIATMRSNDVWLGLPYDLFNFTQVQRMMAFRLDVPVGTYTHQVGSLHLYEQHFQKAESLIRTPTAELMEGIGVAFEGPAMSQVPIGPFLDFYEVLCSQGPLMTTDQLSSWARMVSVEFPSPWQEYFLVMASKWDKDLLPEPWKTCMTPK